MQIEIASVSSKGRVVIPGSIRRRLAFAYAALCLSWSSVQSPGSRSPRVPR
jgi:hypothetical protein